MQHEERSSTPNSDSTNHAVAPVQASRGDSVTPPAMTRPRVVMVSGKHYAYHELVCPIPEREREGGGGQQEEAAKGSECSEGSRLCVSSARHHVVVHMQEALASDEHLLLHILRHFTPVELSVARQVSRLWHNVADSNTIWRPICTQKWPSWQTDMMKTAIMAMGGYAKQYRSMAPRRRSRLEDLLLTIDVVATSHEAGVPVERTIAGVAFDGAADNTNFAPAFYTREWARNNHSSDVLVHQRAAGDAWKFTVKPYIFQTLEDVVAGKLPTEEQAAHCMMMPELRLKLGVVNKKTQQMAHVASCDGGFNLRTKKFYYTEAPEDTNGAYDAALGLPDVESHEGGAWEGFSGDVALPESVGDGNQTHLIDIVLVGTKMATPAEAVYCGQAGAGSPDDESNSSSSSSSSSSSNVRQAGTAGGVTYSFSEIRVGPLFNLTRSALEGHPAGGAHDFIDMLDLKLGGFKQHNNAQWGM